MPLIQNLQYDSKLKLKLLTKTKRKDSVYTGQSLLLRINCV